MVSKKFNFSDYQKKRDGSYYTPEELYFVDEFGRSEDINKYQTELEKNLCRALIRNYFVDKLWGDIAISILNKSKTFDFKNDFKIKIDKLLENDELFSSVFKGNSEVLAEKLNSLRNRLNLAGCQKSTDKNFGKLVVNFFKTEIFGKGFLRKPEDLFKPNDITDYEKNFTVFIVGKEIDDKTYQIGWNEAQDIVKEIRNNLKKETKDLESEIRKKQKNVTHETHISALKNLGVGYTAPLTKLWEIYEKTSSKYEKFNELYNDIEGFRNDGIKFDSNKFNILLEEYPATKKNEKIYIVAAPEQVVNYLSPYVELANKFGEEIGVKIKSKGVKTYDSLLNKLERSKRPDKTASMHDLFRDSFEVSKLQGIKFLLENFEDICNKNNIPLLKSTPELSRSFLFSDKRNVCIFKDFPDDDGNANTQGRIGEVKVYSKQQLKTKDMADLAYKIASDMHDDSGGNNTKWKLIDSGSIFNAQKVETIHNKILKFLKNETIQEVMQKNKLIFSFDINKLDQFKIQSNFNNVAYLLKALERNINVNSLSKEPEDIKRAAYIAFKKQMPNDFDKDDFKTFKLAFSEAELNKFEKETSRRMGVA